MLRKLRNQGDVIHPGRSLNLVAGFLAGKTDQANLQFLNILPRGPRQLDKRPRHISVNFRCDSGGSVLDSDRMQLETDALIRSERSGSEPGGKTISGERLHTEVMTNAGEINIGVPFKDQTQGAVAGMFLLSVEADLDTSRCFRNQPRETSILDI